MIWATKKMTCKPFPCLTKLAFLFFPLPPWENALQKKPISKAGNRAVRQYLYLAAETARQCDPELAAFYERLRSRGKHHNLAVTAVAAKLARRIYAVLKRGKTSPDQGYSFRDLEGEPLSQSEARDLVRLRFPSHRERAKRAATSKAAKNTGRDSGRT